MKFEEIYIKSTLDGSAQPSLFAKSDIEGPRPLLVFLHTWSYDRHNQKSRLAYAEKRGFHLLLPEFRGANLPSNPRCTEACGSPLAKQDIKDAIDYCISNYEVDTDNIFIVGCSGGGHMALLMAGYCPELFRAVAAFVPITDLERWAGESRSYAPMVAACCPNSEEMYTRSPIAYVDDIARANVKVFAGRYDSVVPFRHTLDFYNTMLARHPEAKIYIDIFDGGHEYREALADEWISTQYKKEKGVTVTG